MEQHHFKNDKENSRRDFLKKSLLSGLSAPVLGGLGVASAVAAGQEKQKFSFTTKKYKSIDDIYKISPAYERMRQKNTIFCRWGWDPKYNEPGGRGLSFMTKWFYMVPNPLVEEPGFGKLEHALENASFAGQNDTTGLSGAGVRNEGIFADWDRFTNPKIQEKYPFKSPKHAAHYIKRAARFLGADDVGVAPYDERWIYSKWYDVGKALNKVPGNHEEEAVFPFEIKSVIVTIHEMDKEAMKVPGYLMDAAAGIGYAKMAEAGHKISVFLNNLGYKAIPAGNDTSMSVPTAIQAGLGEYSRMGTMIHPKYGSGVRIQKVYTDLAIEPDQPITFGVQEFCKKCKKCADHCPSKAISLDEEPGEKPTVDSISSHPGVKKWYHDNEKCFSQWEKFGTGCGICLTVCPYNKPGTWVHDLSKMVVSVPIGRDIARQLDDAFGYGNMDNKNLQDFWNKED
ncbi:MAG: reductive dehalogenase [Cytophagales bacterium]|nr:reductive dehalogenase [Cytophagales bacterium]